MKRSLQTLRLDCWQPRRGLYQLTVGNGSTLPRDTRPPAGRKWCELKSDDRVTIEGRLWTVGTVWLVECDPPEHAGQKVISGRHWLTTGEIVKDSLEHSTPK